MNQTADSTITLRVETTADPAALTATAAAVEQVAEASHKQTAATKTLNDATSAATVTANGLSNAKERVKTSSANGAMALLQFSRAAQDIQYGMAGAINNAEGLAMALGLGTGVAGVVTVVGVVLQQVITHLDPFGTKAAEAAAKTKELAEAAQQTAETAEAAAEATEMSTAAWAAHEAQIEATKNKYKELESAINLAMQARAAESKAAAGLDDAQSRLEIAKINDKEQRGILTPQQAEEQRRAAEKGGEQRQFGIAEQRAIEEENAARAKAAIKRGEGAEASRESGRAQTASGWLLNDKEREAAKARVNAEDGFREGMRDTLSQEEIDAENAAKEAEMRVRFAENNPGLDNGRAEAAKKAAEEAADKARRTKRQIEDSHQRQAEAQRALTLDEEQRLNGPYKSRDEALAAARAKEAEAREKAAEAQRLEQGADISQTNRPTNRRAFETRQEADDINSRSRIARMNQQDSAKIAQEEEKAYQEKQRETERQAEAERRAKDAADREADRAKTGAKREFGQLRKSASGEGASDKGLDQMEAAFMAFLDGNSKAMDTYKRLTAQLVAAMPKLEADAKEALAAAESARRGK